MPRDKYAKRSKSNGKASSGRMEYYFVRAVTNIKQNVFLNFVAVSTIALALLILSIFLLLYVNFEGAAESWSKKVQVTAYFDQEPDSRELNMLESRIDALHGTDSIVYVSKSEAIKRFRARLKGQEALLNGVTADILPASLEISLKSEDRNSDAMQSYVAQLKRIPGINEVQYGDEWVKRYDSFMVIARMVGLLLGAFLFLAVVFIVFNTIRLAVYSRKDEIELLSLVGGTRFFIKAPFLIEGILQGFFGAVLSLLILTALYLGFMHSAGNFFSFDPANAGLRFLPFSYVAGMVSGGICFGFVGSLISLRRFITI